MVFFSFTLYRLMRDEMENGYNLTITIGQTSVTATLTLDPELGSLGHITEMHLQEPPMSM